MFDKKNFVRETVDHANATLTKIEEMRGPGITDSDIMRKLIKDAALVIGVYPDRTQTCGVGLHIIKGHRQLKTVAAERKGKSTRLECLPCRSLEEAMTMQMVFGEPDPLH
jgi:hypothetical protein